MMKIEQLKRKETLQNEEPKCLKCGRCLTSKQISKKNKFCCHGCATSYRQMAHDPNIFEIKDKDILYYLLGLIFTDGNLDAFETRVTLSLTQKEVIEYLYPYFCDVAKRKIYEYQPQNCKNAHCSYTIINTNLETINELKKMSLTPKNSSDKQFPNIPLSYISSFLRGVFDGDGCIFNNINKAINKKYQKITITCASEKFVDGLVDILNYIGLTPTVVMDSRRKNNEIKTYYVCLNRQCDVRYFFNFIYKDAQIYINYKKQKFA